MRTLWFPALCVAVVVAVGTINVAVTRNHDQERAAQIASLERRVSRLSEERSDSELARVARSVTRVDRRVRASQFANLLTLNANAWALAVFTESVTCEEGHEAWREEVERIEPQIRDLELENDLRQALFLSSTGSLQEGLISLFRVGGCG